jgi:hypothetical protein
MYTLEISLLLLASFGKKRTILLLSNETSYTNPSCPPEYPTC